MAILPFKQVDVFTNTPFGGNPVAVILDGGNLSTAQMQRIANWTNLSETTFVVPATEPGADYHVRIFTPASELPFAGHPTLGTAHALLEAGMIRPRDGQLVQQCGAGLVKLSVQRDAAGGQSISFELPQPKITELADAQIDDVESILGTELLRTGRPRLIDVGPRWLVAQLPSAEAVVAARPDMARMLAHDLRMHSSGIVIFGEHGEGEEARVEVRAFAPSCGISEDPVCGSGNGCMAVFVRETGQAARFGEAFVSTQGQVVGRAGRIRIGVEANRIRVGGESVTCIEGTMAV